ncbi:MAG: hypothetical protein LBJ24_05770 [Treponema sp.]|jgi:uncharacterized pyridoxamine 5'-phosphate oxidase family protein|nr:hypothetical protein [Treponema sp.]
MTKCFRRTKTGAGLFVLCILCILFAGCTKGETVGTVSYLETNDISAFAAVLQENQNGILANRNGNKLRTQIVTFQFFENNRVYFCTNSSKPMYEQLQRYPYVSYCQYADEYEPVVSINGKVVFVEDAALKSRLINENAHLKRLYHTPGNPIFKVFYINTEEVETFDSEGAKIYKIKRYPCVVCGARFRGFWVLRLIGLNTLRRLTAARAELRRNMNFRDGDGTAVHGTISVQNMVNYA